MANNEVTNALLAGLVESANIFVQAMKSRLDAGGYPSGNSDRGLSSIQDATSIDVPKLEGNIAYIDVVIDLQKAPYAAAFEFGSGLHGKSGQKYEIRPVNASALAFEWQPESVPWGSKKFITVRLFGDGTKGVYFFNYVEHPGIEAKPYLQPTLEEVKEQIKLILKREFRTAIIGYIKGQTVGF